MTGRLRGLPARLTAALAPLAQRGRTHGREVAFALVVATAIAAGLLLGASYRREAAALDAEAARLTLIGQGLSRWDSGFQPPEPGEPALWAASERALGPLTPEPAPPLAVAREIADRAGEIGVARLQIRLVDADSLGEAAHRDVGGWAVETGDAALSARFDGTMDAVIALVGALPSSVEARAVRVADGGDGLRADLLLAVRRLISRPDAASGATPAPEALDSLARYLAPSAPAPAIDDGYAAHLPARPAPAPPPAVAPAPETATRWRVSAILIVADRRTAIVDDRQVAPGDEVAGEGRVTAIERDHVQIVDRAGRTHTLSPSSDEESP